MPATEAQIRANRANSLKSTGPKSTEGKESSRANALKHGLTGDGIVLAQADAAEVDRKAEAYARELNVNDELGRDLARCAALNTVRMNRAADQQTAALSDRVRRAQAEAEASGEDPVEAARRAMFDPSKEACLARKYEAAAERGFFRALKELRQHQRAADVPAAAKAQADEARKSMGQLASFFPGAKPLPAVARPDVARPAVATPPAPPKPAPAPLKTAFPAWNPAFGGSVDVPITIGRAR